MHMTVPLNALIVEDSEDDALLIIEELRAGGYDPTFERTETREATEAALGGSWDIIIADYRLPGFTGLDALGLVRERDPDIPFIIVSGLISEETAVAAMRAGAQDYVLKDNLARLAPAVDRELRDVRVRRERRQALEELRRSEQVLQSIIDSSSAAIYLKDVDGRFIVVNNTSARILGTTKDGAIGRTDHDFLPKDVADRHADHDREVMETCAARESEEPIEQEDGVHTFLSAKFPVYDSAGIVYGVGGISTDITEPARLRRELEQALERERHFSLLLQRALLPDKPDAGPGYDVGAEYVPAFARHEIGGDFYDVFTVGQCRAAILIGDVSGKGLEAAALAAITRSTIHAYVHESASASEALTKANAVLYSRRADAFAFVTVFLVAVDLQTGEISYSGAGHPAPVLCRCNGGMERLRLGQMPLGVLETQDFEEHHDRFQPGDRLVLYTDGISEARRGVEMFDTAGIESVLRERCGLGAREVAKALLDAASEWAEGNLRDDAAVVVVQRDLD